jgi:hypothetical protein
MSPHLCRQTPVAKLRRCSRPRVETTARYRAAVYKTAARNGSSLRRGGHIARRTRLSPANLLGPTSEVARDRAVEMMTTTIRRNCGGSGPTEETPASQRAQEGVSSVSCATLRNRSGRQLLRQMLSVPTIPIYCGGAVGAENSGALMSFCPARASRIQFLRRDGSTFGHERSPTSAAKRCPAPSV